MAEFMEVFCNAQRYCEAHGNCDECPLKNDCCILSIDVDWSRIYRLERTVMDWAKEHPMPKYPTWQEWLTLNGIVYLNESIPSIIARKLGVEPVG